MKYRTPNEVLRDIKNLEKKEQKNKPKHKETNSHRIRRDRLQTTVYTLDEIKKGIKLSRSEIMRRAMKRKYKGKTPPSVGENRNNYFKNYYHARKDIDDRRYK